MAKLEGQTIAASYDQLLHVDADGGGNSTTHVSVKDGDNETTFALTLASDAVMITSTNRLEFGDDGTYIHQSADGVLDLVSDTEIEINATTIDINGAVDISGALITGGEVQQAAAISYKHKTIVPTISSNDAQIVKISLGTYQTAMVEISLMNFSTAYEPDEHAVIDYKAVFHRETGAAVLVLANTDASQATTCNTSITDGDVSIYFTKTAGGWGSVYYADVQTWNCTTEYSYV